MTDTRRTPTEPVEIARGEGPRRLQAACAGLLAAAVALGVAELATAVVNPASSPVVAVGDAVITLVPEPVKEAAIAAFGQHDKTALIAGTLLLTALYAMGVGLVSLRSLGLGSAGIVVFGLVGLAAALTRPAGGPLDGLPSLAGAAAGVVTLRVLIARLPVRDVVPDAGDPGFDRRRFLVASGVAVGVAVVAGGGGRLLQRRFDVSAARDALVLPKPASPAGALPPGADLAGRVDGLTPLFTGNRDFYRIDTALTVPQVRPENYRLSLTGMFDSPRSYTLADLMGRSDLIERDITLTCVSNEVGGGLAGTARWLGVPLGALLRENGVRSDSDQLVCRSTDGMTIGAPTRSALEVEDAMLAFGMNGQPLPVEHGFPVRMIIPGLYGYVSACKWLTRIQATTFGAFDAYWVERGWAASGPIKVESRIDTPASGRSFPAGRRAVAGVAWAQTRGIGRVEVRVDEGQWMDADLSPAVGLDLWRQWVLPHDFAAGPHTITVRATTLDGETQTGDFTDPFPNGASGWHSVVVTAH